MVETSKSVPIESTPDLTGRKALPRLVAGAVIARDEAPLHTFAVRGGCSPSSAM